MTEKEYQTLCNRVRITEAKSAISRVIGLPDEQMTQDVNQAYRLLASVESKLHIMTKPNKDNK